MTKPVLVYASSNPGKVHEMQRQLSSLGFEFKSMTDLGFPPRDVAETGTTLGENAHLKVTAYADDISRHPNLGDRTYIVLSDDTGLAIDGLNGEPGIYVRRWRDRQTHMSDEGIIEYALDRMKGLTGEERRAEMSCVLAICVVNRDRKVSEPRMFDGVLVGHILEEAAPERFEGFPFASLLYVDKWNMVLGAIENLPQVSKDRYLTHRELAVIDAISYLSEIT